MSELYPERPEFRVGDLVLVKKANHTPEIVGKERRVCKVTDNRVFLDGHPRGWNTRNVNINEYLEIVARGVPPMDDTRDYLEKLNELANV